MRTKKMLAIQGSPRKNGNATKMLEIAIEKAVSSGYQIIRVDLYEKNISYCTGCMSCRENGICLIQDDMEEIKKAFLESDLIVISCPTYMANVPAPVKTMFDRLAGAFLKDRMIHKSGSDSQKYILMTTCTTPFPFNRFLGQSSGCLRAMKKAMALTRIRYGGSVVFAGTSAGNKNKNEIPERIINKIKKLI